MQLGLLGGVTRLSLPELALWLAQCGAVAYSHPRFGSVDDLLTRRLSEQVQVSTPPAAALAMPHAHRCVACSAPCAWSPCMCRQPHRLATC